MLTNLPTAPEHLKGPTQIVRWRTEAWAAENLYCPNCTQDRLTRFPANRPVADLYCNQCEAEFELKAQKRNFGASIVNGAYQTLIDRITSHTCPNLVLMHYLDEQGVVHNLTVVPSRFLHSGIVKARKPLAATARRAGWVGSTIRLDLLAHSARIPIVSEGQPIAKSKVRDSWSRTAFVEDTPLSSRGWLVDVLACVEEIDKAAFSLDDVYEFEHRLRKQHPNNHNIRPKIRQQLQVLRDQGILTFEGRGRYRKT